jgi:hypothetical protein
MMKYAGLMEQIDGPAEEERSGLGAECIVTWEELAQIHAPGHQLLFQAF